MDDDRQVRNSYDRMYGVCDGFPHTKPSVITDAGILGVGGVRRVVVQTFRAPDAGDTIFIESIGEEGVTRLVLSPKVSAAIANQRESLNTKARKAGAKQAVRTRKAAGIEPFKRKVE